MLAAFSFIELAYGFGLLAILVFAATYLLKQRAADDPGSGPPRKNSALRNGASAALQALGVAVFLVTAMNLTGAWRYLWTPNPVLDLNNVIFPDLNGEWEGVLLSNGPLRNQELDTSQVQPKPDCTVFGLGNIDKFACINVRVSIDMSFLDTSVALGAGTRSMSHTTSVWLKRRSGGQNAKLMYLYEVRQAGSTRKDDRRFSGAAELDILPGKTLVLDGGYWTDRNWIDAGNTAGRIRLTRMQP
jgi:hypothetical protein